MPEIFVSYSRRNKEFTENFIKELRERDYSDEDLWVDWKDIPPSSKWEDEIRKGIENSNAIRKVLDKFQQKVEKHLVTNSQAEQMQQQLMNEQQNLVQFKDQLQMQLMEKEQSMNKKIFDKITQFLKKYNQSKKHKIILGNSMGTNVLEADSNLDITEVVIKGLNEDYQKGDNAETDSIGGK